MATTCYTQKRDRWRSQTQRAQKKLTQDVPLGARAQEGNPANFNKMVSNPGRITLNLHMAVCQSEGVARFAVGGGPVAGIAKHMAPLFRSQWHHTHQHPHVMDVYCGTLAHQLCLHGIRRIDMLSIDVEGGEHGVLLQSISHAWLSVLLLWRRMITTL